MRGCIIDRKAISIHVLREEDDDCNSFIALATFLISIHVLREEDDCQKYCRIHIQNDLNPRPPRGGRRGTVTADTGWA